jgi:hypothetical protein
MTSTYLLRLILSSINWHLSLSRSRLTLQTAICSYCGVYETRNIALILLDVARYFGELYNLHTFIVELDTSKCGSNNLSPVPLLVKHAHVFQVPNELS